MRKSIFSVSLFLFLIATATTQADPGDYLEIYPTKLSLSGVSTPYSVVEGQKVLLYCDWMVAPSNVDRQWYAGGKEHRFPVRIEVDGVVVGSFEGVLGPRTRIGSAPGSRGFAVNKTSGPAAWTANSLGDHKAVCVVNEPKAVSDQWPQNNTTEPVIIKVTSNSRPATTLKSAPAVLSAASLVIEAESLIPTAVATGGQMARQDMTGFGSGWGGNAQLFWRAPAPAGYKPNLMTEFRIPTAGTYDLVLYYTMAPDFGQFTVYVDGKSVTSRDGYGPQVRLGQVSLGRHQLTAGRHELAFEVTGRNAQSTSYIIGIDRLHLNAAP